VTRRDHEPPRATGRWGWRYHHTGIPTRQRRDGERYLPQLKMSVSGFPDSPYGVEWMRFDADCPISDLVKTVPHVAFEVDDIDEALEGKEVLSAPSSPSAGVKVAMIIDNGGPVELMQFVSERKEGRVTEPERLVDGARAPTKAEVADFIGKQNAARWADLTRFIAASYPGVFDVEWLFGGKRYGWTLRFKKSKSFCSLVPERRRFKVLLVFGGAERPKVERLLPELVSHVREDYVGSTTYHDGKWVFVTVDSAEVLADIKRLLALKRPPRPGLQAAARRGVPGARTRRPAKG